MTAELAAGAGNNFRRLDPAALACEWTARMKMTACVHEGFAAALAIPATAAARVKMA
jgi:hypothetical protein